MIARQLALKWSPAPRLVSVGTHDDGGAHDPPYKGVTVVFDNGLFANVSFTLEEPGRWIALGNAGMAGDGRQLRFEDGTTFDADMLYESAVAAREPLGSGDGPLRAPVGGPRMRIGR